MIFNYNTIFRLYLDFKKKQKQDLHNLKYENRNLKEGDVVVRNPKKTIKKYADRQGVVYSIRNSNNHWCLVKWQGRHTLAPELADNLFILKKEYIIMEEKEDAKELYAVMVVGNRMPTKVYEDYKEAEVEATRLAEKERATVYVLKAITKLTLTNVTITKL